MLGQHRRRWPNITAASGRRRAFAVYCALKNQPRQMTVTSDISRILITTCAFELFSSISVIFSYMQLLTHFPGINHEKYFYL